MGRIVFQKMLTQSVRLWEAGSHVLWWMREHYVFFPANNEGRQMGSRDFLMLKIMKGAFIPPCSAPLTFPVIETHETEKQSSGPFPGRDNLSFQIKEQLQVSTSLPRLNHFLKYQPFFFNLYQYNFFP